MLSGFLPLSRHNAANAASVLALIAIAFLVNQSALSGFWRFDDGWLLDYASRFSPLDYFLVPAITRGYSFNNLTPFNPLIYDLNIWLFGVSPKGFYLQHLAVLAGCAVMTFLLLRIWVSPGFAFSGALLFLLGAPSLIVSQQLMVGHYVAGLMFSLLSLFFYIRSLEQKRVWLVLLAALFYLFATTCKEIYVPLPITLLVIHKATLKRRLLYSLPMFAWVVCYTLWRYRVLGGFIGGYNGPPREIAWTESLLEFVNIPQLLLGTTPLSTIVMVVMTGLFFYSLLTRRLNLGLIGITALVVLLPLVPLLGYPGITRPDRYLFLPWWIISILCAVILANLPSRRFPYRIGISLLLIVTVALHSQQVMREVQPRLEVFDTTYRLFASPAPDTVFLSRNSNAYHQDTVLNGLRNAMNRVNNSDLQRIGILTRRENLTSATSSSYSIKIYDLSCDCIRTLDDEMFNQGGSQKAKQPGILVVTLSPPFPPLFNPAEGAIEQLRQAGNNLHLSGWTALAREDAEQQFLLVTPARPKETKLTNHVMDTDNDRIARYGFDLRLSFHDEKSATIALSQLCLLTRSMLTPVGLILDTGERSCSGFLRPHP